jgi:hypothetical protein
MFVCSELEGALQHARGELELAKRQADTWERQATHLTRKHQAVDKALYETLQVRVGCLQHSAVCRGVLAVGRGVLWCY